ncbi:MAG: NlpC/P60 family protein [Nocardioides sp.]
MTHGRNRLIAAGVATLAVAGVVGMLPSTPAQAAPSIKDVQAKVDDLYRQAEVAGERFDAANLRLKQLRAELKDLQADQKHQGEQLSGVRDQVRDSVLSQFEGSNMSAVGQVVTSEDPKVFLAGLSTMSAYDGIQNSLLTDYANQVNALDLRREATAHRTDQVADTEADLKKAKAEIDDKLAEAKKVLDGLQADQREALLSRDSTRVSAADIGASGSAASAIAFAMAQVGKAYVYGAAGDSAYDCSGLTMRAWGAAGVSLPHSSAAQYNSGRHISESELQPGDLVFYYSPISHVGMYIGNGMIVNAENPSVGVKVTSLHEMPYVGAVRPG